MTVGQWTWKEQLAAVKKRHDSLLELLNLYKKDVAELDKVLLTSGSPGLSEAVKRYAESLRSLEKAESAWGQDPKDMLARPDLPDAVRADLQGLSEETEADRKRKLFEDGGEEKP